MAADSSGNLIYGGLASDYNYNINSSYAIAVYYSAALGSEKWSKYLYDGVDPITMSAINENDGSLIFGSLSTTDLTIY
jgi:hypothetical protein